MMKKSQSIVIGDDYRITRTPDGLRVEVLDYHAGALSLDRETLKLLGFRAVDGGAGRGGAVGRGAERRGAVSD